ncbi:unnamed protein product [Peniophora sp. CBMAI 1063]|nr:unnamed protein product [Peniophora sp. CBMAI 1063]
MEVPQSGYQQPVGMYQQYQADYAAQTAQFNPMSANTRLWAQNQPQLPYNPNSGAYINSWPSSSANSAPAQSGASPQYDGHQPQPPSFEHYSQHVQNFDTPQVQSTAGPARVPRRQTAQEKVVQADPTRQSSASRSERSRGQRGESSASAHTSQPPTTATCTSSQSGSTSALTLPGSSSTDASLNNTPGPAGNLSSARDTIAVDATKKKSRLTNLDRRDICIYQRDTPGVRQEDIAQKWGVERSTISKVLKEKNKWLFISAEETVEIAKARPPKFEHIEEKLLEWCLTKHDAGSAILDKEIRDKALELAQGSASATNKFKASHGWIDAFKRRFGIRKGIFLGEGTLHEKNRALGNGVGNVSIMDIGPTMMDSLYRMGEYDPNAAAREVVYDLPIWKKSIQELTEKRGGRPWHELTEEEQQASQAAGDNDMYPHYQMAAEEAKLEDTALEEARNETYELEDAALAAGDESFDRRATFDEIMHEKLAAIDYESVDVPELDVPPVPGQHPDDIEPTPGPSGERAHEAIWEVIRFCMPRRGRVFSNGHCAVLLEIWARTMIIYERQRRAGARRLAYEQVYFKDRKNDVKHAEEMIAEKERDFALNPTGEPTGKDVVARQTRKEDLEALLQLKEAHDELIKDPDQATWLNQVHDAQREEDPSLVPIAPVASTSALPLSPPPTEAQPIASSPTSGSSSSSPAGSSGALLTPRSALQDDGIEIYTPTSLPPEGHFLRRMLTRPDSSLVSVQCPTKPFCNPEDLNFPPELLYGGGAPGSVGAPLWAESGTVWTGMGLFGDSPQDEPPDVDMSNAPPS